MRWGENGWWGLFISFVMDLWEAKSSGEKSWWWGSLKQHAHRVNREQRGGNRTDNACQGCGWVCVCVCVCTRLSKHRACSAVIEGTSVERVLVNAASNKRRLKQWGKTRKNKSAGGRWMTRVWCVTYWCYTVTELGSSDLDTIHLHYWIHWISLLCLCPYAQNMCSCVCVCLLCLCVAMWEGVWGWEECRWTACEGQQLRGPVSRITWQPYPMKAYAQMSLLGKWVNKRGRGGGGGGVCAGLLLWLQLDLFHDLHTSAISGPHRSVSLSLPFFLPSVTELSAFTA